MRIAALVVLPLGLLELVLAVPSQPPFHHSLSPLSKHTRPWWKRLPDTLIEAVYGRSFDSKHFQQHVLVDSRTIAQYGNDVVLRFNVTAQDEAEGLRDAADTLLLDIWESSRDWVDIRLSSDVVPSLLGLLPSSLVPKHTVLMRQSDLVYAVYNTFPHLGGPHSSHPAALFNHRTHDDQVVLSPSLNQETNIFFRDYQPLSVIEPWMRLMASLFNTHVRLINIGTSFEGRNIPALRIGVHPTNDQDPERSRRKTVLVTGGVHAREWISTSTVNYVAYSMITGYGKNSLITRMLEAFDFVFVPSVNPDGYAYTWSTDRLWRKNRQTTSAPFCHGIDLDRSFEFHWDPLTSGNPCSESFAGSEAFQAVESRALADWAKNETDNNNVTFLAYLDLHSYSQSVLYPYSYSCSEYPPGLENLEELAYGLAKAIRVSTSHSYEVMPACEGNAFATQREAKAATTRPSGTLLTRMEAAGGSALDWFYHELDIPYAYQIKLRDRGAYGFLLPKDHIVPTGKEILEAVLEMGRFFQDLYDFRSRADERLNKAEVGVKCKPSAAGECNQAFRGSVVEAHTGTESMITSDDSRRESTGKASEFYPAGKSFRRQG